MSLPTLIARELTLNLGNSLHPLRNKNTLRKNKTFILSNKTAFSINLWICLQFPINAQNAHLFAKKPFKIRGLPVLVTVRQNVALKFIHKCKN